MEKKTIGKFISVLRKSQGMTQQDLADRLNVSNKAVSRWERDECSPDISLIPAIAEIFDVTCDELLKGERILQTETPESKPPKVEKQLKNIIMRTLSAFKTSSVISMSIAIVGFIFMLGISYGFFRPVVGFAVMMIFEIGSLAVSFLALNKAKFLKTSNELFENADDELKHEFNVTLGKYSFSAFFTAFSSVLLSLPLVLTVSDYVYSVLELESYVLYVVLIAFVLWAIYLGIEKTFIRLITQEETRSVKEKALEKYRRKLNLIQLPLLVVAAILYFLAPYIVKDYHSDVDTIVCLFGLACQIISILAFVFFCIVHKENRKSYLLIGIRNCLLNIPVLVAANSRVVSWSSSAWADSYMKHVSWSTFDIVNCVMAFFLIYLVFSLIDRAMKRNEK